MVLAIPLVHVRCMWSAAAPQRLHVRWWTQAAWRFGDQGM